MLEFAMDLISQAVSNNVYVFCLLIVVMILMGSKHAPSNLEQDYEIPVSMPTYHKHDFEAKQLHNRSEQATNASRVSSAYETATLNNRGNINYRIANSADNADEGDDELRRRVEEFIAKVNREWRAEKLGMCIST
ncbi:hypothetical protein DITRI_Ditri07aG0075400 [Diplodiscus trichospermus]